VEVADQEGLLISVRGERRTAAARCHDRMAGMGESSDYVRLHGGRGPKCSMGQALTPVANRGAHA
jgi:hypothetical protein